jgi:hypothetical protein
LVSQAGVSPQRLANSVSIGHIDPDGYPSAPPALSRWRRLASFQEKLTFLAAEPDSRHFWV